MNKFALIKNKCFLFLRDNVCKKGSNGFTLAGADARHIVNDRRKSAFTLAGADARHIVNDRRKSAFTLAETLTTLIVIGIIAVLTIPALKGDVDSKVLDSQKKTFNTKLKQGLSNMQIHSALAEEYATTADFIEAMKKYMNITKSCTSTKLSDCFASKIKESQSSTKFETKNIKTSADIEASFASTSDLGAIVFSDGTSAIIAHNPNCVITNKFDTTTDTTRCFVMIYDINGSQAPNIIGEDMDTINLSYGDYGHGIEIGEVFTPRSYTVDECTRAMDDSDQIKACFYEDDYWAYAAHKCAKEGKKLPDRQQLKDIAKELYGEDVNSSGTTADLTIKNQELWQKLGATDGVIFWSSEPSGMYEAGRGMYARTFSQTSTSYNYYNIPGRNKSNIKAFCVGK